MTKKCIVKKLVALAILFVGIGFYFWLFPAGQARIAFHLITGIYESSVQSQVDELEDRAIHKQVFSPSEKQFLHDLYSVFATGARLTYVLHQSGDLMDHYLSLRGTNFALEPSIFLQNTKVQAAMLVIRQQISHDVQNGGVKSFYVSPSFHIPDPSSPDSVYGLYWGNVSATVLPINAQKMSIQWRATVPWVWPSYDLLKKKYGDYHAENVRIPSLGAVFGQYLFIDNGLGEYLTHIGIAKTFLAYATWSEVY